MTATEIENNFTYHPPSPQQQRKYETIRSQAKDLAHYFNAVCPPSAELTTAIRHIENAVMWANAAIARHTNTE